MRFGVLQIGEECNSARLTRLFDNFASPVFSIIMAVWAVIFLEKWKRYQSELCARWDVSEQEINEDQV